MRRPITDWIVDYGDGPRQVTIPHAWRQDVPVTWEGPALYHTTVHVPDGPSHLLFNGVSYEAQVSINGKHVLTHRGIWDAFSVPSGSYAGREVELEVRVIKNGGPTFPVPDVASGFLPYVFNTFGGIYGHVELVEGAKDPVPDKPAVQRASVQGRKIFADGKPIYPRGLLHWGWYPELGHTNVGVEQIQIEIGAARQKGFNLIKFCLWVPPHRYLDALEGHDMWAWMELPLWNPTADPVKQEQMFLELERIVRQYKHHGRILIWTCGCELSSSTPPEYRERLYRMVKELTGSPLVKDNSGGAEMYGGDPREFGDFYDFHPYCETQFYPSVLDSLLPGPRIEKPLLLGEFNDHDTHRDLLRLVEERPYWASAEPDLNEKGVRWQYDLPQVLQESRLARDHRSAARLHLSSSHKNVFIRDYVLRATRARQDISGYVVTGIRDTPISSSGTFDDWGHDKVGNYLSANKRDCLYLLPSRRPPWVNGGNRPGWDDTHNHFAGTIRFLIGIHTEDGVNGPMEWEITAARCEDSYVRGQSEVTSLSALESAQLAEVFWDAEPGEYLLRAWLGDASCKWPIHVYSRHRISLDDWQIHDPAGYLSELKAAGSENQICTAIPPDLGVRLSEGSHVLLFLLDECTRPLPFWRECAFEYGEPGHNFAADAAAEAFRAAPSEDLENDLYDKALAYLKRPEPRWLLDGFADKWERLLPISPDRAIDLPALQQHLPADAEIEVVMNRIDTRTHQEAPILIRAKSKGTLIATTLRPFGGLGCQPTSLMQNPAGCALLKQLLDSFELN